ncbi:hypothetical protein ACFVIZ_16905 [Streptomyces anulatus]|uniref:hypothetical protein n=1 Tax=Streptomyces anulatus TaxID=1892 RepID=UPI0036307BBE
MACDEYRQALEGIIAANSPRDSFAAFAEAFKAAIRSTTSPFGQLAGCGRACSKSATARKTAGHSSTAAKKTPGKKVAAKKRSAS